MRILKYELSNGNVVSSLQEAEMSGLKFKTYLEEPRVSRIKRTPLAQEMFEKFNRVKKVEG